MATKFKSGVSGEFIKRVIISGSNDESIRHGITSIPQDYYPKTNSWSFSNDDAYRYYRIEMIGVYDGKVSEPIDEVVMCRSDIRQKGYSSFDMNVVTEKSGMLYWADGYHRGWNAYVNGNKVPVYRANINFKAIAIPAGENNIQFVFNPIFKVGLLVFYASFFLSVSIALVAMAFYRYGRESV